MLIRQRNICFNKQIVKFFLFRKKMPYREVYYNLLYSNSVTKKEILKEFRVVHKHLWKIATSCCRYAMCKSSIKKN